MNLKYLIGMDEYALYETAIGLRNDFDETRFLEVESSIAELEELAKPRNKRTLATIKAWNTARRWILEKEGIL
jgi:hypothetical protein